LGFKRLQSLVIRECYLPANFELERIVGSLEFFSLGKFYEIKR
jgi:hypothetical protein